jgi:Icc-related predicted phosphoesterase
MRWTPDRTRALHAESRTWLRENLALPFNGKTVVVSHHCPHPLSVSREYDGDHLTPAFCSDLSPEISEFQPVLWVHGHTHFCFDYVVPETRTRVVCNPRGYVREYFNGRSVENMEFQMLKIVEI